MRLDHLRQLYPDFDIIYHRHIQEANFGVVKNTNFKFLKERLTFVRLYLNEHRQLSPTERTEFVQKALLSAGDLRHGQQWHPISDKNKEPGEPSLLSKFKGSVPRFKGPDEESLRKDASKKARKVSDSDFLREIKGIQDEDIAASIHEATVLAHTHLSSLIDVVVNKITHAVLQMQQEECERRVRREI